MKVWKVWLLNDDQISFTMPDLLLISVLCFSHRFEVFKGLKIDTVLRNFTVFEYTKDKVSLLMLFLLFCSYSWQFFSPAFCFMWRKNVVLFWQQNKHKVSFGERWHQVYFSALRCAHWTISPYHIMQLWTKEIAAVPLLLRIKEFCTDVTSERALSISTCFRIILSLDRTDKEVDRSQTGTALQ